MKIREKLMTILNEAGVEYSSVEVRPFFTPQEGALRLNLLRYRDEKIVELGYAVVENVPCNNFLRYSDEFQEVSIKHEICHLVVEGSHLSFLEKYCNRSVYLFRELMAHKEFEKRYPHLVETYKKRWEWYIESCMKGPMPEPIIHVIESDLLGSTCRVIATLIFTPARLRQKFEEINRLDLFEKMRELLQNYETFYNKNICKPYEELIKLLQGSMPDMLKGPL